jgi:hypothetical protein
MGLAFFIVSRQRKAIAAIVFTCFVIVRNILVLFQHFIGRWIRFHIEIVGTSRSTRPGNAPRWLKRGRMQIAIDLVIALALLITVTIAHNGGRADNYWWPFPHLLLPACILGWIAA